MPTENRSLEQRGHVRYQLKENIFVAIQGNYFEDLASVVDFNSNGVGFFSVCKGREPAGKFIIFDLISDREQVILRSLSARVIFTCEISLTNKETIDEASRRYGLKFIHLSALQKRQLDIITKKYALPEPRNTVSS
ncbi:MAG: hypothetical protein L3J49_00695 [Desulfobulbaceae bacterium]|nr:hypothetical protein [Desulfobulbaceae bacterium]